MISSDMSFNSDMKRKNKKVYLLQGEKKEEKAKKNRWASTGVKPDQQIRSPTSQTLKQSMKSDITVAGKK